jgi:hypothetical protein
MSYLEKAQDLYAMITEGKMIEAFDKHYHEDIVMIEATGDVREGKAFNREHEEKFVAGIKEFHGFGINGITSNEEEGITMVESWMDVTMAEGYRMKMEEVAVQQWEDDLIIRERFYYNAPK